MDGASRQGRGRPRVTFMAFGGDIRYGRGRISLLAPWTVVKPEMIGLDQDEARREGYLGPKATTLIFYLLV